MAASSRKIRACQSTAGVSRAEERPGLFTRASTYLGPSTLPSNPRSSRGWKVRDR